MHGTTHKHHALQKSHSNRNGILDVQLITEHPTSRKHLINDGQDLRNMVELDYTHHCAVIRAASIIRYIEPATVAELHWATCVLAIPHITWAMCALKIISRDPDAHVSASARARTPLHKIDT